MSSWIIPSTRSFAVSSLDLAIRSAMSRRDFLARASFFSCSVRRRWIDSLIWTCKCQRRYAGSNQQGLL